jgi:hypothetical protein
MDERLAAVEACWRAEAEAVVRGLRDWRAQHPQATLAELEAALDARLDGLRARLLEELALASRATELRGADGAGLGCPACAGRLEARGVQERQVVTQGDQVVRLRRQYATCSACGTGLFPPG